MNHLHLVAIFMFIVMMLANVLLIFVYDFIRSTWMKIGLGVLVGLLTTMVGIIIGGMAG